MTFLEKTISPFASLRVQLVLVVTIVGVSALVAGMVWYQSRLMWKEYLGGAFAAGVALFEQIAIIDPATLNQDFSLAVPGFLISAVVPQRIVTADNRLSLKFPDLPGSFFETRLSLLFDQSNSTFEGKRVAIRIFSPAKRYELSAIENTAGIGLGSRLGVLVKTLAESCGASVLFIQADEQYWLRIDGSTIWGCQATPPDWRLPVLLFGAIIVMIALSFCINRSEIIEHLASRIATSASDGQYQPIEPEGPGEVKKIAMAVNTLFTNERQRLEQRALLLSGISHDLGTPATRLKLRTALIADPELRHKLDADIDHMTDMIQGVLTYTRGEISSEERRQVSMLALVQSLVDDYADVGQPVTLEPIKDIVFARAQSIFTTGGDQSQIRLTARTRLLCQCRPNQVRRALSNLIDNALKYGKSATLSLSATSDEVTISVCDQGGPAAPLDIKAYTAAFKRGANAAIHKGVGLGLTIVESVARSHGGKLDFEHVDAGSKVSLTLPRS